MIVPESRHMSTSVFFAADEHGPQCAALSSDAIAAVMPMRADSAEYAEYADVYATIF